MIYSLIDIQLQITCNPPFNILYITLDDYRSLNLLFCWLLMICIVRTCRTHMNRWLSQIMATTLVFIQNCICQVRWVKNSPAKRALWNFSWPHLTIFLSRAFKPLLTFWQVCVCSLRSLHKLQCFALASPQQHWCFLPSLRSGKKPAIRPRAFVKP